MSDTRGGAILEADGVTFAHPGAVVPLFSGLRLAVRAGECLGIVGPNGSGKTTLVRLLAGLLPPAGGRVLLEGRPISEVAPRERARRLAAVLPEAPLLFNFSVLEIALMGRAPHLGTWGLEGAADYDAARRALADVGLAGLEARAVHDLSSGERQRAILARALTQEPRILLLDEPTAFLDLKHGIAVYEILARLQRERDLTVVVVSHDLHLAARHAARLVLLHRGRIAADGSPAEVLTPAILGPVYETDVEVLRDPASGAPIVIPRSAAARR
jgi:ABC-type cobalamin/Fe3+-siderophores transport system ATPase subunit